VRDSVLTIDDATGVRSARQDAGLSQRALAERSGVAQPTIARIERGQVDPRLSTVAALLDACDCELRIEPRGAPSPTQPPPARPRATTALAALTPLERIVTGVAERAATRDPRRGGDAFDPLAILALLATHEVALVVTGDGAARAAGEPVVPEVLEVTCPWSGENRRRLAGVLRILGATARRDEATPLLFDADRLATGPRWELRTHEGPLDLVGSLDERAFGRLVGAARPVELTPGVVAAVAR
jgi:transcriptional regulator with XRE-family HTH domain